MIPSASRPPRRAPLLPPRLGGTSFRLGLVALVLVSSACVRRGTYETTLGNLGRAEAEAEALREELARLEAEQEVEIERRDSIQDALGQRIAVLEAAQERLTRERRELELQLADARAEVDRLQTLQGLRGAEYQSLQRRLESLRAVEQEVRERNAIYQDVIERFRSLMDGGQLSVSIDRGRMVIQLPQDVLFPSGSATLGGEGRRVIAEVGAVLADFDDRRFQIEGHTDNVPIATERFPSNWELSSARALAVVKLLAEQGVSPDNLSGAGFGEYQPVASNEDRDTRRLNRRIEIVMLPNLDVIATTQVPGR